VKVLASGLLPAHLYHRSRTSRLRLFEGEGVTAKRAPFDILDLDIFIGSEHSSARIILLALGRFFEEQ
jgi:hypothetical protein